MDIQENLKEWLAHYQKEKAEIEKSIEKGNQNKELLKIKLDIACNARDRLSHNQERRQEFYKKHIEKIEKEYHHLVDNHRTFLDENNKNLRYVEAMIQEIESSIAQYSA